MPITDVRELIAFDHLDINTSAVSLLSRHGVTVHILDHYGNHAGALVPSDDQAGAQVVRQQVALTGAPDIRLAVARSIVAATAANVRWAMDTNLLDSAFDSLSRQLDQCADTAALMGQEGNYRRTAWAALDTMARLPDSGQGPL